MPIAVTEEHQALADTVRRWTADHSPPDVARDVVEADDDRLPAFWGDLAAQGLLGLHLPEQHGGAGYGLVELAVTLEQFGHALVPGPFLPTTLASALVAHAGDDVLAKQVLPGLADGSSVGAAAYDPDGLTAVRTPEGLRVRGSTGPVLGAPLANVFVLGAVGEDGPTWFVAHGDEVSVESLAPSDRTRRLGTVTLQDVVIDAGRVLEGLRSDDVRDLAHLLVAAELSGIAAWCLETAAEYATIREQFGRPIGQFQAIKHRCADMLVRVEQSRAVAWDAARAGEEEQDERSLAASVAIAIAADAGVENAKDCIQVLGGIGFTWEHDAHFYLKRAAALRQLVGGTTAPRQRAARLALDGVRRRLALDLPEEQAGPLRSEIRDFIAGLEGLDEHEQRRRVADAGYAEPHWPSPWGRDADPIEQLVISQEFARHDVAVPDIVIGKWVLPTIISQGTREQQERFIPATFHGDIVWCQMFSEPGAGSDLASLSTRARRVDGGWRLTGQKIWTSMAQHADWGMCLARTDPQAPKHEGITAFLVDMTTPGLDIRPLREITGRAMFNEVFLDDVFVPDDCVVGDVNDGWRAARTTLANERVAMSSGSTMGRGVEGLLASMGGLRGDDDSVLLDRAGRLVCDGQSLGLLGFRTTLAQLSGLEPGASSSVRKLVGMGHAQDVAEVSMELLGPAGATLEGTAEERVSGFVHARCLTIAGGTTEVQKNVVAERILGLPRDDAR